MRSDALILLDRASKPKGKSKGGRLAADPRLAEAFGSMQRVLATPVRPEPKPSPGTEPESKKHRARILKKHRARARAFAVALTLALALALIR